MNWQPARLGLVAGCLQRAGIGSVRPPQGLDHLLGRSLGEQFDLRLADS
jgi:hypothetical protein